MTSRLINFGDVISQVGNVLFNRNPNHSISGATVTQYAYVDAQL